MKKLGIIGGLGPMATAYFLQLLVQMTDAVTDQEHMEIYTISRPSMPDRTRYILGESNESPLPQLIKTGKELKDLGADILAIPCITAHYFHDKLEDEIGIHIINAVKETGDYLQYRNIKRVGIMATDGTVKSMLFQKALGYKGMQSLILSETAQEKLMNIIYHEIKAGKRPLLEEFAEISDELRGKGAQVILLACTELSLMKKRFHLEAGFLDVMEILAAKAVQECNHLNPKYQELITC